MCRSYGAWQCSGGGPVILKALLAHFRCLHSILVSVCQSYFTLLRIAHSCIMQKNQGNSKFWRKIMHISNYIPLNRKTVSEITHGFHVQIHQSASFHCKKARVMKALVVESEPKADRKTRTVSTSQPNVKWLGSQFSHDCVWNFPLEFNYHITFQKQITQKYITIDVRVQNYIR